VPRTDRIKPFCGYDSYYRHKGTRRRQRFGCLARLLHGSSEALKSDTGRYGANAHKVFVLDRSESSLASHPETPGSVPIPNDENFTRNPRNTPRLNLSAVISPALGPFVDGWAAGCVLPCDTPHHETRMAVKTRNFAFIATAFAAFIARETDVTRAM
jgi:hypothetical protein